MNIMGTYPIDFAQPPPPSATSQCRLHAPLPRPCRGDPDGRCAGQWKWL